MQRYRKWFAYLVSDTNPEPRDKRPAGAGPTTRGGRELAIFACFAMFSAAATAFLPSSVVGGDGTVSMHGSPVTMFGSPVTMHESPEFMQESPYMTQEQCTPYTPCGPCLPLHLDARVEYLGWWTKNPGLPPLVTTAPIGTDQENAGALGQPGTQILFGDGMLSEDAQSGFGLGLVGWVDACRTIGFEFDYATLDDKTTDFHASGDGAGNPILSVPFVNAIGYGQDIRLLSHPDVVDGAISIGTTSSFRTAEVLLRKAVIVDCERRTDIVIGYRYGQLKDSLQANGRRVTLEATDDIAEGTTFDSFDAFDSKNTFNGVEFGLITGQDLGHWNIELLAKLALGNTKSSVFIDGSTTEQAPDGEPDTGDGGLLAMPSNMGQYDQSSFGAMSELGLQLDYEFACRWRASLGYTFIYWYHVARASEHMDTTLNLAQLPPGPSVGPQRPDFQWQTTGFWAQGLTFGLEYRY